MPVRSRTAHPASALLRLVRGAIALIAIADVAAAAGSTSAQAAPDQPADSVEVQGRWAFTERQSADGPAYMATTAAVEDGDTWLLLACQPGHRLAARLMHAGAFPFTLDKARPAELRSAAFGTHAVSVTPMSPGQFVLDPRLLAELLPLLLEDETILVSLTASDAQPHQYSFATRPNDLALAHIRSGCLAASDEN